MSRRSWVLVWVLLGSLLSIGHLIVWGRLDLTPTINVVELEWTITALAGTGYSGWFLIDSFGDYRWLQGSGRNGSNRDAAEILILLAAVLVGVHLLFLVLGILGMVTPTTGRPTPAGLVAGVSFTWWGQLLVLLLARVQVLRSRLRAER